MRVHPPGSWADPVGHQVGCLSPEIGIAVGRPKILGRPTRAIPTVKNSKNSRFPRPVETPVDGNI